MLKSMGESDYHTFRTHYWDWRQHDRSEVFKEESLGKTVANENNQPIVTGELFKDGWDTVCWFNGSGNVDIQKGTICNPNNKTGPLLRCPFPDSCNTDNPKWPTFNQVRDAINKPFYDTKSYDMMTTDESFRNFMEGFESVEIGDCAENTLCKCEVGGVNCGVNSSIPLQRHLHNTVSRREKFWTRYIPQFILHFNCVCRFTLF